MQECCNAARSRAAVLGYLRCQLGRNIPHHLGQRVGIDLVEEAVELDMLGHGRARAKQLKVMLERLLEIQNSHAIVIKQRLDIRVITVVELFEDALRLYDEVPQKEWCTTTTFCTWNK
jgi:hypothetical protein